MKKITWTFFTANQNKKEKAQKVAKLLLNQMPNSEVINVEKYWKTENAYKFIIETTLGETDFDAAVLKCLKLSAQICGTWIMSYDENQERFGLDFNKTKFSHFGRIEFNVIYCIFAEVDFEHLSNST